MEGRAAGGDDAFLEADDLLLAGLLLRVAAHCLDFDMESVEEMAIAAHHLHLARLGHAGEAGGELADDFRFVGAQLVEIDCRRGETDAGFRDVVGLLDHRRHMQQGLGRNAADIEADAAQRRVAFDDHRLQAQVGGAERGGITAGPGTEHQHFAFEVDLAGEFAHRRCCRRLPSPLCGRGAGGEGGRRRCDRDRRSASADS